MTDKLNLQPTIGFMNSHLSLISFSWHILLFLPPIRVVGFYTPHLSPPIWYPKSISGIMLTKVINSTVTILSNDL